MKILVIFYSLNGSTKFISDLISEKTGADQLRLKPLKDIKKEGLMRIFWGGRQVMSKKKPALEPFDKNPQEYDMIFIGTPVWSWTFTPALRTFFDQVELKGKKIALFNCNGGSPKDTIKHMQAELDGNEFIGQAEFLEPIERQDAGRAEAEKWIEEVLSKVNPANFLNN